MKTYRKSGHHNSGTLVSSPAVSSPKKFVFLSHLFIILLGFAAYANSIHGGLLYDDIDMIQNSPAVRASVPVMSLFTRSLSSGAGMESNFYRPLQVLSYRINYAVSRLDVRGYHLTNIVLHILTALCIYWLIQILFNQGLLSCTAAILFVVHPIHTEAVSYISGRADPLASLFMLAAMIFYVRGPEQKYRNAWWYVLLLSTYVCALFSKEYSLILPFLLLAYHAVFRRRIVPAPFVSIATMAVAYILVRVLFLKIPSVPATTDTVLDRVPGVFAAMWAYAKLLFWPIGLHMEYGTRLFSWTDPKVLAGLILASGLFVFGYLQRHNKIILFALGWFGVTLLPVANLYRINAFMAEHFLYLPSMGFFLLIAHALCAVYDEKRFRFAALILMSGCLLFLLALTFRQNHYWQDHLTFYKRTLAFTPDNPRIHYNLGRLYLDQGDVANAVTSLSRSIACDPKKFEAYINRGIAYCKMNVYDKAMQDFHKGVELRPGLPEAYFNRGIAYGRQGKYDEAVSDLTQAIQLNPGYILAYTSRASLHMMRKEYDLVWGDIHKAQSLGVRVDPAFLEELRKISGRRN